MIRSNNYKHFAIAYCAECKKPFLKKTGGTASLKGSFRKINSKTCSKKCSRKYNKRKAVAVNKTVIKIVTKRQILAKRKK